METQQLETTEGLRLIGMLALRFHMLDEAQLESALTQQASSEEKKPVGQTLVEMGLISASQLQFLLNAQAMKAQRSRDIKFGSIAVENGFVTQQQVEAALLRQKEAFIRDKRTLLIGDILVTDGLLSEAQKQSIIKAQQRITQLQQPAADETGTEEQPVSLEQGVTLSISKDGMCATLHAAHGIPEGELRQRTDELMEEHNICHGRVAEHLLTEWLVQGESRDEHFIIAEGTPPTHGHGGKISYHFDTDPLKAGKIREGDIIDFKDRGEIPQVDEGALLAELSDPDPGSSGTNIYGEEVPPPAVKKNVLLCDSSVASSEDGSQAIAKQSGSPSLSKTGVLSVFPLYRVDGDVGYKTGHVEFDGDIQISGTVEEGFHVKGGALSAAELEACEIEVKGDVVIHGGILGARIRAGGNLMAAYIHNSVLEVDGDVLVQKEIRGCDIKSGGGLYSESSIILDSHITAKQGISARDIGSDVSGPSTLNIGSDAMLELRITRINETNSSLQKEIEQWHEEITALSAENEQINMEIAEQAQVQDRSQVEQRELGEQRKQHIANGDSTQAEKLIQQINESSQRAAIAEQKLNKLFARQDELETVEREKRQFIEDAENQIHLNTQELSVLQQQMTEQQTEVYIKVTGTLYPMTTITTSNTSVKTKQEMEALIIREAMRRNQTGDEIWKVVTESVK